MIRTKGNKFRIALNDPKINSDISYIGIELTKCWCTTFKEWGKPAEQAIFLAPNGKHYRISVEEIKQCPLYETNRSDV